MDACMHGCMYRGCMFRLWVTSNSCKSATCLVSGIHWCSGSPTALFMLTASPLVNPSGLHMGVPPHHPFEWDFPQLQVPGDEWDRPWLNGPFFIGKVDVLRPDFFHGRTNGIQWDIGYPSLGPTKSSLLCCVHWLTCVCPPRNCSLSSYERIRSLRSIILLLAFKSQMTLNMTLQDTHQCHQSNIYIAAAGPATFQGNQENHSSSTPFSLQS